MNKSHHCDNMEEENKKNVGLTSLKSMSKKEQDLLQNSEEKYKHFFELAPLAYQSLNEKGYIIEVNRAWLDALGYSYDEVIGRWFGDFLTQEFIDYFKEKFPKFKKAGEIYNVEFEMIKKDGSHIIVSFDGRIAYDEQGNFKQAHCIFKNITERKQMEEELKNALSEWEVTFNASKDSTMLVDDKFKIFKANLATERFLSKHLNEILGKTCYELVHGTDKPPDICPLKMAKHTKKHEGIELYVPEKNVWLSVTVDPILDDKGNLTCAVHIIKDITERKKAEGKIKQQNIRLMKLDELKTAFLNVTSHELRAPMASIKGYIQMLLRKKLGETTDEQEKALEVVLRNANRLDNLIQDILDVSRLESGAMKFNPEQKEMQRMIDEVTETMQSSADLKDIEINRDVEEKIPDLTIDQARIKQVIINLVNNAIKFSPEGSTINIRAKKEKDHILFELQDFGRGIPKNKQKKIFETFYQVESGKNMKFGGAGLGLSISYGIVVAHGGKIWVESKGKLGEGSTFKFTLPVKPVKDIEGIFKEIDMFGLKKQ